MDTDIEEINKDSLDEISVTSTSGLCGPTINYNSREAFLKAISIGCQAVVACARQLNIMDEEHGKGDYGTRLARAAKAVQDAVQRNEIDGRNLYATFEQISCIIRETADDSALEMYSEFFYNIAKAFSKHETEIEVTALIWLNALTYANEAMKAKVFPVEEQALLTSLVAIEKDMKNAIDEDLDPIQVYEVAVHAAESFTTEVLNAQRSKAANSKGPKYPDPRAHAVGIWMRGSFEGTKLKLSHVTNKS